MKRATTSMPTAVLAATFVLAFAAPAAAQEHVTPPATLDAIAADHASASTADRTELRRLLERSEVREIAGAAGVDIVAATDAIAVLSDADAGRLAEQARQVDAALAGGDTVVISTTVIIIALLVLLIILVA